MQALGPFLTFLDDHSEATYLQHFNTQQAGTLAASPGLHQEFAFMSTVTVSALLGSVGGADTLTVVTRFSRPPMMCKEPRASCACCLYAGAH